MENTRFLYKYFQINGHKSISELLYYSLFFLERTAKFKRYFVEADMKLTDVLRKEFIIPSLQGTTKEECIRLMIDVLAEHKVITNRERIYEAVIAREEIMTTGVGNGIAIPHCKDNSTRDFAVALGITENSIDFDAIDENPVHIIFLLVGPESQPGMHIKLLSRISRLMGKEDIRDQLLKMKSAAEIHSLLAEEEDKFFDME